MWWLFLTPTRIIIITPLCARLMYRYKCEVKTSSKRTHVHASQWDSYLKIRLTLGRKVWFLLQRLRNWKQCRFIAARKSSELLESRVFPFGYVTARLNSELLTLLWVSAAASGSKSVRTWFKVEKKNSRTGAWNFRIKADKQWNKLWAHRSYCWLF